MRSPIFHPYFFASSLSTITPARSRCHDVIWSAGIWNSGYTLRTSSGSVPNCAKKCSGLSSLYSPPNQLSWFGGLYKDDKPEHFFAQFGTDPDEVLKVYPEFQMPADQITSWQRDRAGVIVDRELAKKYGWKIGDRITLKGTIYPVNLDLTIRGIYTAPQPTQSVYFHWKYVEEAVNWAKDTAGTFGIMAASPQDVSRIAGQLDDTFRNSPQ